MILNFHKYHGTGNDFIMIDNRGKNFPKEDTSLVEKLCTRRFGIGADGLILIENVQGYNFRMVYYNSDGRQSSMCGNGGRCAALFAHRLGIAPEEMIFVAIDGPHEAKIKDEIVHLKMIDVDAVEKLQDAVVLNTGSPHYVWHWHEPVKNVDVLPEAHAIRYSKRFSEEGINVNFVNFSDNEKITMRTYERGVEDETRSCGTGVTAAAIAAYILQEKSSQNQQHFQIETLGGNLEVTFTPSGKKFTNIWLSGPAVKVFKGELQV